MAMWFSFFGGTEKGECLKTILVTRVFNDWAMRGFKALKRHKTTQITKVMELVRFKYFESHDTALCEKPTETVSLVNRPSLKLAVYLSFT